MNGVTCDVYEVLNVLIITVAAHHSKNWVCINPYVQHVTHNAFSRYVQGHPDFSDALAAIDVLRQNGCVLNCDLFWILHEQKI